MLLAALPAAARILPWRVIARLASPGSLDPHARHRLEWLGILLRNRVVRLWGGCLTRSLLRARYLRQMGVAAELRLGIRRRGERWEGHAWVCVDGCAVEEPEGTASFVPMWSSQCGCR